jgi:uncharacterized protein (DUF1015 family)
MMAYPHAPELDRCLKRATERDPDVSVTADDDVTHELWVIGDSAVIDKFTNLFDALPSLYIADGHHRSAAAARVAAARTGTEGWSHRYFLSVIFPHHEMTILDYNRVVRDLNGRTPEQLLAEIANRFAVTPSQSPVRPAAASEVGMFLGGRWYQLRLLPDFLRETDPIARLPITLLTRNLIEPILGIADPRSDKRIDFVGGGRGLAELERRVNSGEMAVAFALHPTAMDDLMAVSDANGIMPPKSTWFEPKLADGMVSHVLD